MGEAVRGTAGETPGKQQTVFVLVFVMFYVSLHHLA
jgi:hypothetical protein